VIRGKYAYMSPEQVAGKPLDGRSDLFSTSIVLFELVTGRRLFKARTREETLARVRRAEVPSPKGYRPEITDDLERLLLKSLARRPEDRFQTAGEMLDSLSGIMVREGYRVTNTDLANYLMQVIEAVQSQKGRKRTRTGRAMPPSAVVVLAAEAAPPPRSVAAPRKTMASLSQKWEEIVLASGGEVWERSDGSTLVVWVAKGGLRDAIGRAVRAGKTLQEVTVAAGYRLSVGITPGVARLMANTKRPSPGWELAGPFYLARWLMNLSAHRGRLLLTEVASKQLEERTKLLGRIPIQGNRFINLHELEG
jgi:hypothetical protein